MASMKPAKKSVMAAPVRPQLLFMVRVKDANEVLLAGDFTRWSDAPIALHKGGKDEWRTTLDLAPGEYQYRLLVDGSWQDDPQAAKRTPNSMGGDNCVFHVPGARPKQ